MKEQAPGDVIREACAREVDWMARGHVAHEHVILNKVSEQIRAIDLDRMFFGNGIEAVLFVIGRMIKSENIMYLHCLVKAYNRVRSIDLHDPMEPFSDKAKWWPRVTVESVQ